MSPHALTEPLPTTTPIPVNIVPIHVQLVLPHPLIVPLVSKPTISTRILVSTHVHKDITQICHPENVELVIHLAKLAMLDLELPPENVLSVLNIPIVNLDKPVAHLQEDVSTLKPFVTVMKFTKLDKNGVILVTTEPSYMYPFVKLNAHAECGVIPLLTHANFATITVNVVMEELKTNVPNVMKDNT